MAIAERLTALQVVRRTSLPSAPDPIEQARRGLTAAVARLANTLGSGRASQVAKPEKWQARAWSYYETLGEIHYAADFFGANLARVRLVVQRLKPGEGEQGGEWEEVTSGPAFAALERLKGPRGDRSEIQAAFGAIMFVVGEGYLFGTNDGGREVWEFLSADEVVIDLREGVAVRKRRHNDRAGQETYTLTDELGGTVAPGECVALRLWSAHPRFSDQPDAPLLAVLDLCEELRLLPRAVRSRARSRLASAGILVIPNEITEPSQTPGHDENPEEDPVLADLIEVAGTAIDDEESAAASVPIVLRVDGEHAKNVQHVTFVDPSATYPETEREVHVLSRVAMGLNLPPEVLTGMGGVNHWSAWEITAAVWTQHLEPMCRSLCGDLTSALIEPIAGDTFRVWYDDAEIVTRPDRAADAMQLHDRLAISDAALREAGGWAKTDEPDDAERRRRIGVMLKDASLATGGEPTAPQAAPAGPPMGGEPPAGPGNTTQGPPDPTDAATAGAMVVALARCREAAGARVLTRLQRPSAVAKPDLTRVPGSRVCAAIGPAAIEELGLDPAKLVRGAASCLIAAGYPPTLADQVERHAAATLFDAEPAALT